MLTHYHAYIFPCVRKCWNGEGERHDKHVVALFGRPGVYLVIIGIWAASFLLISPVVFGLIGYFGFTNTMFGCDAIYYKNILTPSYPGVALLNLTVMWFCYCLVFCRLQSDSYSDGLEHKRPRPYMTFLILLTYTLCILPSLIYSGVLWMMGEDVFTNGVLTCIYWVMYGINFLVYLGSSQRMREAYTTLGTDLRGWLCPQPGSHWQLSPFSTSAALSYPAVGDSKSREEGAVTHKVAGNINIAFSTDDQTNTTSL